MRIALVHWGRNGGGPMFHNEMVRALRARIPALAQSVSANTTYSLAVKLRGSDLPVRTFDSRLGALLGLIRLPLIAWRWRNWLRAQRVDVVISSMEQVWQSLVCPLTTPRGLQYVFVLHDAEFHSGEGNLIQRIGRTLEIRRADHIVVLSTPPPHVVDRIGSQRIIELRLPAYATVGTNRLAPKELRTVGRTRIGFIGRIGAYKGLDLFASCAASLLRSHPDKFEFVAYGNGYLDADLAANDAVEWHVGWLSDEEFESVLASFDILMLPYIEATQSGPAALALTLGVPMVCTPVGGLVRQIEESGAGVVATAVSAEALAHATVALAAPAPYRSASTNALAASRTTYSWDRFAGELLDHLNQ